MNGRSRRGSGRSELGFASLLVALGAVASCAVERDVAGDSYGTGGGTQVGSGKFSASGGKTSPIIKGEAVEDGRPVVEAARRPPPISGGTLAALRDGIRAVVADADRDRVLIVNFVSRTIEATFQLEAGAEPGRVVEGAEGRVFVALRGTGEVLTLDVPSLSLGERRAACQAPRGMAHVPSSDTLLVACAEGQLVELPGLGDALTALPVAVDARDIVLRGSERAVTRFRAADVLFGDSAGNWLSRPLPHSAAPSGVFAPQVAWRMVIGSDQTLVIAHQRAAIDPLVVSDEHGSAGAGGGGSGFFDGGITSSYGTSTSSGCGGVVQTVVSLMTASGTITTSQQLGGIVLPVDVAVSPKDGTVAVANAGRIDHELSARPATSVGVYSRATLTTLRTKAGCVASDVLWQAKSPVVAVAFDPSGRLLALTRQPAQLLVSDPVLSAADAIDLEGESVLDTGHEIFHRDSGIGVACASCHPEGTDDGKVWHFHPIGLRRTQPLDVALEGTEPFHWGGEFADFEALMGEVFNTRMSGPKESPERLTALKEYIFSLKPRPGVRVPDDEEALRGKALFESYRTQCSTCHTGPKLTNGGDADIGKGAVMQVPSLLGISRRPPYMSDGCAPTLAARFEPACGGPQHGLTNDLTADETSDLIAYLETL